MNTKTIFFRPSSRRCTLCKKTWKIWKRRPRLNASRLSKRQDSLIWRESETGTGKRWSTSIIWTRTTRECYLKWKSAWSRSVKIKTSSTNSCSMLNQLTNHSCSSLTSINKNMANSTPFRPRLLRQSKVGQASFPRRPSRLSRKIRSLPQQLCQSNCSKLTAFKNLAKVTSPVMMTLQL